MKKYIISDPEILGGKPTIKGTRIPISQILFLLKEGYTVEAINEFYPQVDVKTLKKTIDEAAKVIDNASQTL